MIRKVIRRARKAFAFMPSLFSCIITILSLKEDVIKGRNSSLKEVRYNLRLPVFYFNCEISWESKTSNIDNNGVLICDNENGGITSSTGKIIALVTCGTVKLSKSFNLSVSKQSPYEIVDVGNNLLTDSVILGANSDANAIRSNLVLPVVTETGCSVIWKSNDPAITDEGFVNRNAVREHKFVELEAFIKSGDIKKSKKFHLRVEPKKGNGRKPILILVPHGDDEIFIAYSIICEAVRNDQEVYICFSTNVDHRGIDYGKLRWKETIEALGYLGVPVNHIINLGYSNAWKGRHIYHLENTETTFSLIGNCYTYGTLIPDFHYLLHGEHARYTRGNIINDIIECIEFINPGAVYVCDLDSHPDHRALSLLFDEAVRKMIDKGDIKFKIYKGHVYSTGCYSNHDFFNRHYIKPVKRPRRNIFYRYIMGKDMGNPSYIWSERISVMTPEYLFDRDVNRNIVIQSLLRYQRMFTAIDSFINSDAVFWEKTTDNLIYKALISSNANSTEYLRDSKTNDIEDICRFYPKYTNSIWKAPQKGEINIRFHDAVEINQIRIYQPNVFMNIIFRIDIEIRGKKYTKYGLFKKVIDFYINEGKINSINISTIGKFGRYAGITEIEVFNNLKKKCLSSSRKIKNKSDPISKWIYRYNEDIIASNIFLEKTNDLNLNIKE